MTRKQPSKEWCDKCDAPVPVIPAEKCDVEGCPYPHPDSKGATMNCKHEQLVATSSKASDGRPLYACAAKCGAPLFSVKPMEIIVVRGRKPLDNAIAKS